MPPYDRPVASRWLTFEGLDNVRDVGGLPLRSGGTTRSGVLFRSASLRHATPADVRRLVDELGVRLVLDLRTPGEIDTDGPTAVAQAGVETVALTFVGAGHDTLPRAGDDTDPMLRIYLSYLTDHPANVTEAVRRLAGVLDGAALVHCLAGKDRTGVLVALLLDAIGVQRDAVVADYALSGERIEALFRRWTTADGEPMPSAEELASHRSRPEVVRSLLSRLDETCGDGSAGGPAGWLVANGLSSQALDVLRDRLTDR